MRKYMMLLGKESFWLLGVAAIAFCVGIIISVDWLTNICWSTTVQRNFLRHDLN